MQDLLGLILIGGGLLAVLVTMASARQARRERVGRKKPFAAYTAKGHKPWITLQGGQ